MFHTAISSHSLAFRHHHQKQLQEIKTMSDDTEASTSRCEKQSLELRASTSNRMAAHISELKQVESRLRVLEEEALTLKEALLESVEERAKLMSEIYEDFDTTIRHCLMQRGEANKGELYGHRFQIGKVCVMISTLFIHQTVITSKCLELILLF